MRSEAKTEAAADVSFNLNGEFRAVLSDSRSRLSQVLREEFHLVGTKVGCDAGVCGACTVLFNGQAGCSCLTAVGQLNAAKIETIEGLCASSPPFNRLQNTF